MYVVEPGYQIYTVEDMDSVATVARIFPMSLSTPVLGTTHPQVELISKTLRLAVSYNMKLSFHLKSGVTVENA